MVSKTIDPCSNQGVPAFASPKPLAKESFVEATARHSPQPHMKISKPKFLLGIPVALISLELFLGVLLGYLLPRLFGRKIPSVLFNIGSWKLHFHHWFIGIGILISALYYNFLPFPQFSYGFLGGLIFQGITCYPDWHKIIIRKKFIE